VIQAPELAIAPLDLLVTPVRMLRNVLPRIAMRTVLATRPQEGAPATTGGSGRVARSKCALVEVGR